MPASHPTCHAGSPSPGYRFVNLIYIHQHFVTSAGSSGTRSYDIGRYLIEMGHEVTMICGLHDQSALPCIPRWRLFHVQQIDGIKVVACNVVYSNKFNVPARLWSFVKFAALATVAVLSVRSPDLIFATSTPLTVGLPGRFGAAIRRIPYVFEVRDLWPEDLLAAGRLKPGLQYRAWEWLELFCYTAASKVLLVSSGYHGRLLERGLPPDQLETVALGADGRLYADMHPDLAYIKQHGLAGKTIAVYAGAHGDANGLMQVIDTAEKLRDRDDIALLLIGDGKAKSRIRTSVAERSLENVHLVDPVPKHRLPDVLAACHIGLIILKQITRPRWVMPNKLFDYMFSGLPTIVNFPGTTAEFVEVAGVGLASTPGSAEDLAAKIKYLADDRELRRAIGHRAREVAWREYDRRSIAMRLAEIFEDCIRKRRRHN